MADAEQQFINEQYHICSKGAGQTNTPNPKNHQFLLLMTKILIRSLSGGAPTRKQMEGGGARARAIKPKTCPKKCPRLMRTHFMNHTRASILAPVGGTGFHGQCFLERVAVENTI